MPIYRKGKCICRRCHKEFDWVEYKQEINSYSRLKVSFEKIPEEAIAECFLSPNNSPMFRVNCKHCACENEFPAPENSTQ